MSAENILTQRSSAKVLKLNFYKFFEGKIEFYGPSSASTQGFRNLARRNKTMLHTLNWPAHKVAYIGIFLEFLTQIFSFSPLSSLFFFISTLWVTLRPIFHFFMVWSNWLFQLEFQNENLALLCKLTVGSRQLHNKKTEFEKMAIESILLPYLDKKT